VTPRRTGQECLPGFRCTYVLGTTLNAMVFARGANANKHAKRPVQMLTQTVITFGI